MSRSGIICAGNWIVDLVHEVTHWPDESDLVRITDQSRSVGGGPANVLAALSRLQTELSLWPMGAVGDDDYGRFIISECIRRNLPTNGLHLKPGIATAHTHVMSVAGQSRTFFYQGGANDVLSAQDFAPGTFAQTPARIFYLGYLTLLAQLDRFDSDGLTDAARVLARAKQAGLVTCVDLVSAARPDFEAIVRAAAPQIDYLVLNEVEASRATHYDAADLAHPTALADMGQRLLEAGVCRAVVIHCSANCYWAGADGSAHLLPVDVLNPKDIASHLGAGDAFCAGLLYALHEVWPAEDALRLAQKTARASLRGVNASSAVPPLSQLMAEV